MSENTDNQNDPAAAEGTIRDEATAGKTPTPAENAAPAFPDHTAPAPSTYTSAGETPTADATPSAPSAPAAPTAPATHAAPPAPQASWQSPAPYSAPAPSAPAAMPSQAQAPTQPQPHTPAQPTQAYPPAYGQAGPTGQPNLGHAAPQHPQQTQPTVQYTGQQPNYGNGSFGQPPQQPPVAGGATAGAKAPKRRGAGAIVAAIAIAALVGGASGAGISAWAVSQNQPSSSTSATGPQTITVNNPNDASLATAVAAKASPSVVTISVNDGSSGGTGSGVILSKDGYVLTNTHVVTLDGATAKPTIQVTTNDGRLFTGTLVGTDPVADLAVIKLDKASDLSPITWGDSTKLNVGDSVVAIGAPLGLSGTVTTGIVSALNRAITVASSAAPKGDSEEAPAPDDGQGEGTPQNPYDFWNFDVPGQKGESQPQQGQAKSAISLAVIQTDAAINPGNSGGALLNDKGELIGINVAIASAGSGSSEGQSGSIGVGFSIPAALAQRISKEIIADGTGSHGLLGASVGDASADAKLASVTAGALVKEVSAGGAAEKAGIKAGDVITGFNGVSVASATDLTAQVRSLAAGSDAKLSVYRDGKTQDIDVTLGELTE